MSQAIRRFQVNQCYFGTPGNRNLMGPLSADDGLLAPVFIIAALGTVSV
ncbi:MAG TPA: hypothetical protein VMG63_26135 [Terriglobia bacterium]|nr:hypothetical protein [Terriglobia bacterium]